ncbi:tripartite tricarboxylate transporter TctB family protein [Aureimonas fodinaquatilis]|uniref:Tripartite tricarboxylate transporter TctB family protein n=1 Tax=Aureimonas fodinaquatilis TaxID=2565783 RepID=A0A5B0DYQ9_9HYPH|nr:tripartite tricarboxylate transporter TctB family protein [Aureimonas fodinaquatilis]KAA0971643.1 tripartite tricarboxylate transporter TctB family protein [Aureimonas fodinaquatilis]
MTDKPRLRVPHLYACVLVALLLVGAVLIQQGLKLQYYSRLGPGAGFFPIWIGGLLVVLCVIGLIVNFRDLREGPPVYASDASPWRMVAMLASLGLLWWCIELFGFRLSVFAYMLIAPLLITRVSFLAIIPTAVLASFGAAYVFETWLYVRLPPAQIPALAALGL